MIARLLGNLKYLGNDQYPPLISQELFEQAQHKKLQKQNANPVNINPLKEIKELLVCKECSGNIQRRINGSGTERWFCVNDHRHISTKVGSATILKEIKDCLQQFTIHGTQFIEPTDTEEINRVTQEIERLLLQGSSNDEFLRMMIRDIAQKRYQNSQSHYGVAAYRQNLLKEILSNEALDSNKISQLLCKIEVDFIGNLTLHERRA